MEGSAKELRPQQAVQVCFEGQSLTVSDGRVVAGISSQEWKFVRPPTREHLRINSSTFIQIAPDQYLSVQRVSAKVCFYNLTCTEVFKDQLITRSFPATNFDTENHFTFATESSFLLKNLSVFAVWVLEGNEKHGLDYLNNQDEFHIRNQVSGKYLSWNPVLQSFELVDRSKTQALTLFKLNLGKQTNGKRHEREPFQLEFREFNRELVFRIHQNGKILNLTAVTLEAPFPDLRFRAPFAPTNKSASFLSRVACELRELHKQLYELVGFGCTYGGEGFPTQDNPRFERAPFLVRASESPQQRIFAEHQQNLTCLIALEKTLRFLGAKIFRMLLKRDAASGHDGHALSIPLPEGRKNLNDVFIILDIPQRLWSFAQHLWKAFLCEPNIFDADKKNTSEEKQSKITITPEERQLFQRT